MADAFIKIYKKMLKWEWYDEPNTKVLFLHCLLRANWEKCEWHGVEINPGQFVTSIAKLAEETGLSNRQARTALEHLEATGELTSTCTNKYRIITIKKWDEYQGATSKKASKRQATDKQPGNQPTTVKEYKELKNKRINKYYDDDRLDEAFKNFMAMRVKIRKPMSDHAIDLAKKKLEKLSGGDIEKAIAILDQSVLGSWQGLYELKEKEKTPAQKSGGNTRAYTSDFFAELEREAINGF